MPSTRTVTNRPQPTGSAIVTGQPPLRAPANGMRAGSVNGRSKAAASSRASPRMDSAYPRSGVMANSMTASSEPISARASVPGAAIGPITRMPSCSVPMPSSRVEQIIPSEIRP